MGGNTTYIGTNNIAEYLAMIHLAALLAARGDSTTPIYTDSKNTLAWLRRGGSRTTLTRRPDTAATLDLLARADAWLAANGPIRNPILKWPHRAVGRNPRRLRPQEQIDSPTNYYDIVMKRTRQLSILRNDPWLEPLRTGHRGPSCRRRAQARPPYGRQRLARRLRQRTPIFRPSPLRRRQLGVPRMGAQRHGHTLSGRFLELETHTAVRAQTPRRRSVGRMGRAFLPRRHTRRPALQDARGVARRRRRTHTGLRHARNPRPPRPTSSPRRSTSPQAFPLDRQGLRSPIPSPCSSTSAT